MMINSKTAAPIDLLKLIHKKNVQDINPRIEICFKNIYQHSSNNS